jgi:hypothetical protein
MKLVTLTRCPRIGVFFLSEKGWVYIAQNESMPGLIKIGCSLKHPSIRLAELESTGVPTPFECAYCALVPNHESVEKSLHRIFSEQRVNERREFFKVSPAQVVVSLRTLTKIEYEEKTYLTEEEEKQEVARIELEMAEQKRRDEFEAISNQRNEIVSCAHECLEHMVSQKEFYLYCAEQIDRSIEKYKRSMLGNIMSTTPGEFDHDSTYLGGDLHRVARILTDGKGFVYVGEAKRNPLIGFPFRAGMGIAKWANDTLQIGIHDPNNGYKMSGLGCLLWPSGDAFIGRWHYYGIEREGIQLGKKNKLWLIDDEGKTLFLEESKWKDKSKLKGVLKDILPATLRMGMNF